MSVYHVISAEMIDLLMGERMPTLPILTAVVKNNEMERRRNIIDTTAHHAVVREMPDQDFDVKRLRTGLTVWSESTWKRVGRLCSQGYRGL